MSKITIEQTEKDLNRLFGSAEPREGYLDELEDRLLNLYEKDMELEMISVKEKPVMHWALVRAAALVLVVAMFIAVGPSQVLAQMQALLGYVPGYGFVDVNDVRMMGTPLSQTKGDVTVTIKQVLVNQEGTYVVMKVEGLPPQEEMYYALQPFEGEEIEAWHKRNEELWNGTGTRLTLDDGTVIDEQFFQAAPWEGFFTFPVLPKDTLGFNLDIPRLPAVPEGMAPGNWHFEIDLSYLVNPEDAPTGEDYGTIYGEGNFNLPTPIPVETSSVPETNYGFSFEVLEVVYAETETAIRVDVKGLPSGWQVAYRSLDGRLLDDLGNQYNVIYGPTMGQAPDGTYLMTFEPVSQDAKQLTLEILYLAADLTVADQAVVIDFGQNAQLGDVIPMDSTVEFLGIPVHFTAVRIHDEDVAHIPEQIPLTTYEFSIDPVPVVNGVQVNGLMFGPEAIDLLGAQFGSSGSGPGVTMGGGGGGGGAGPDPENPEEIMLSMSLGIPAELSLPQGVVVLPLENFSVLVNGPFAISWDVENGQ